MELKLGSAEYVELVKTVLFVKINLSTVHSFNVGVTRKRKTVHYSYRYFSGKNFVKSVPTNSPKFVTTFFSITS